MADVIYCVSVDIMCSDCDRFMGTLMKLIKIEDYESEGKKICDYLNQERIMPICYICSATKGDTKKGTLRRLDK